MKSINLIPAARLHARRRRAHVRRCVAGCAVYAAAAVAAVLACNGVWGRADASLPNRLAEAKASVDRIAGELAAARADTDTAQSTLSASRSIVEQPDWSLMMKLLAIKEGDDIVLRECRAQPRDAAAANTAPNLAANAAAASERVREAVKRGNKPAAKVHAAPAEPTMVVSISGLGRSQPAVSQFVLRLEALHLFSKVVLLDTNREMFLGGEALGFRIECSLDEPAAGPSGAIAAGGTPQ